MTQTKSFIFAILVSGFLVTIVFAGHKGNTIVLGHGGGGNHGSYGQGSGHGCGPGLVMKTGLLKLPVFFILFNLIYFFNFI